METGMKSAREDAREDRREQGRKGSARGRGGGQGKDWDEFFLHPNPLASFWVETDCQLPTFTIKYSKVVITG